MTSEPELSHDGEKALNFIRDEPAEEDFFKSHSRLARAVAAAINGQRGLKVVGLLGPWGSGKSTVIRILQTALESDTATTKTYCFAYDAWLQQNDPARRAFLETLIQFLVQKELTTADRWRTRLGQLNGSIEDSETTTTPSLTTAGRFIIFSLFFVPLGIPLIGLDTITHALSDKPSIIARWLLAVGATFTLLPGIVASVIYLSWRPKGWPRTRESWTGHRAPHEDDSILSILVNKAVHTVRNRVMRSPEPTTIEFQDIFREIMQDVAADGRRFIFIIDNLDRLPEEDAVSMWGTIRSFFLGSIETGNIRKASEMPTVILPIDQEAVQRMYEVRHGTNAKQLAASFMDKTFDLTFRVSVPVMSDWKAFLSQQFTLVFGDEITDELIHNANCFYEDLILRTGAPVTPRTINSLVNYIGTLWLQWRGEKIEFASIIYYGVFRAEVDLDIGLAVNEPRAGIGEIDPMWQRAIAAMHYGAGPEVAVQILIEPQLREAIANFEPDGFTQHASIAGFETILQRVVGSPPEIGAPPAPDPIFLEHAARLIHAANLPQTASMRATWRSLCALQTKAAVWKALNPEIEQALAAFISHCEAKKLGAFIKAVGGKLGAIEEGDFSEPATRASFVAIAKLLNAAAKTAGLPAVTVAVPGPPEGYLHVLSLCGNDPELMKRLIGKAPAADLVRTLSANLANEQQSSSVDSQVGALVTRGSPIPWEELTNTASQIVETPGANQFAVGPALAILGRLRAKSKGLPERIKQLADNGNLFQRFNELYANAESDGGSQALALILLANANTDAPSGRTWDNVFSERPQLIELTDTAVREFAPTNGTMLLIHAAETHPGVLPIVQPIVSNRVKKNLLGPMNIGNFITELPSHLACVDEGTERQFIVRMSEYPTFFEKLKATAFEGNTLTIFHALIEHSGDTESVAATLLREKLEEVTSAQWKAGVHGNAEPLKIANSYVKNVAPLRLGASLDDALHELIEDIVANDESSLRDRWFGAINLLSDAAKLTLLSFVRDRILSGNPVSGLVGLLSVANDELVVQGGFEERPDDSIKYVILEVMGDPTAEPWQTRNATAVAAWVSQSRPATLAYLSERLNEAWKVGTAEQKAQLENLQTAWMLPQINPPPSDVVSSTVEQAPAAAGDTTTGEAAPG